MEPLVFVKLIYLSLVVSFILKLKKHKNKEEVGFFLQIVEVSAFFFFFFSCFSCLLGLFIVLLM